MPIQNFGKLKSPIEWPGVRKEIETVVSDLLGPRPKKRMELQTKTLDERDYRGYVRKRINYFVDEWDRISAWLFVPDGKEEVPGILCLHRKVAQGKDESAGIEGDSRYALAQRYAEMGYVTLAPDCILAGDRVPRGHEAYDSRPFYKSSGKMSVAAKMLNDHLHALDVFSDMKRVDSARIGVVGHGLGGFNALMLTAFDDRVQACVASSAFTRFSTDKQLDRWAEDEALSLIPKLKGMDPKDIGFDWEHVISMGAPSPTLVVSNTEESTWSNPKSCDKAVTEAAKVYKILGASMALDHFSHRDGDELTPEVLELADDWFERWL
jgi:dienelactone hydrolase